MYPHRIRLRGPWECEPLARRPPDDTPLPDPRSMRMPCRWGAAGLTDFAGRVRFRRRFGYPGRIDADERVWLAFDGAADWAEVRLNGVALGEHTGDGRFEFEVTSLLRPRNELLVEVTGDAANGGLYGEVALEVRCVVFLRRVRATATERADGVWLEVGGELVGAGERSLELYVLLGRSTVAYAPVTAVSGSMPFRLTAEGLPRDEWRGKEGKPGAAVVQVDLVNAAAVWYTIRLEVPLAVAAGTDREG
jgi:hypothetical protein